MSLTRQDVMNLAAKHSATNASAALCFADAEALARTGTERGLAMAVHRALNSLRHSVGVCHPDYWEAWEAVRASDAAFERWMVQS